MEAELSVDGVFGWKSMHWSLVHLKGLLASESVDLPGLLRNLFGEKFIYLTRRHKVKQAVSFLRYQRDGRASSLDTPHPLTDYCYSDAWLDFMITTLGVVESRWEDLFRGIGVEPLRISYEEFDDVHHRDALVRRVLDFLELDVPTPLFSKPLHRRRIRDGLNAEWRERYMDGFFLHDYARWTEFINTFHRQERQAGGGGYNV